MKSDIQAFLEIPFRLVPFPGIRQDPSCELAGTVSRTGKTLAIQYEASGNLDHIEFAGSALAPLRMDRLWKATCFELFLTTPDRDDYWEFNLSPALHWNAYHFDRYREGMREESLLNELPFQLERADNRFRLSLEFDISILISTKKPISAGITAVIRTQDGQTDYWALTHKGSEPDFHRRDSFILQL